MKKTTLLFALFFTGIAIAQQPYYNDVDLTLTGQALYQELQQKIDINNNTFTYGDIRDSVKFTDEDPQNASNVLLIYGYDDSNCTNQRSRDKDDFGGTTCEYNREHTFARSNANPSMGTVNNATTGIGADPHNLRPSDQQMNNNRGSKKFAAGSGNAGNVGSGNWYPGDEWKGDVARIMMYMYTRFGDRCLPSLNGVGATQSGNDMLQIYLQWNIEDPVSDLEDQRNPYTETNYGNRNPFIDNPYLATLIWGGDAAEDRWNLFSVNDNLLSQISIAPNPATEKVSIYNININEPVTAIIYSVNGTKVTELEINDKKTIDISSLSNGLYLLKVSSGNASITKKLIVN